MTTQPSEEAIRKACEEAGIDPYKLGTAYEKWPGETARRLLLALARRIAAVRIGQR